MNSLEKLSATVLAEYINGDLKLADEDLIIDLANSLINSEDEIEIVNIKNILSDITSNIEYQVNEFDDVPLETNDVIKYLYYGDSWQLDEYYMNDQPDNYKFDENFVSNKIKLKCDACTDQEFESGFVVVPTNYTARDFHEIRYEYMTVIRDDKIIFKIDKNGKKCKI